jgi:hypothetical protein
MNGSSGTLMQAVRGPILLITLGVLLTVDHVGPYAFWRTWPVLIIVFGLLKLLERTASRRPDGSETQGGNLP